MWRISGLCHFGESGGPGDIIKELRNESQSPLAGSTAAQKPASSTIVLLKPKDAARLLKVSLSWLAKARMRGDGPPFIKIGGRSIRYAETALIQWMKSRQRLSTSE